VVIRPAVVEDEAELRRLWDEMRAVAQARGDSFPDFAIQVITANGCHGFVAEKDGMLIGCVYIKEGVQFADTKVVKVQAPYVVPSERTKSAGVSPALMTAVTQFAHKQNMPLLAPGGAFERVDGGE
jgi:hypothetical protein